MKNISALTALPVLVLTSASAWAQPAAPEAAPAPAAKPAAEAAQPAPAQPAAEAPAAEAPAADAAATTESTGEEAAAADSAEAPAAEAPAAEAPAAEAPAAEAPAAEASATATSEEAAVAVEVPVEEPAAEEAEKTGTAGHKKDFFMQSEDGNFKLAIGGRVQARFTRESEDTDATDAEYGVFFSIPRARIHLKGHAYSKDLKYKFQADFGKGSAALKDFYMDYRFGDWAHLRVGQDKRPFSRQQITSSGSQQFVDRAITDKAFGNGRDVGLMLHNNYTKAEGVTYAFGVYNGSGDKGQFSGSGEADLTTGEVEVSDGKFSNVPGEFEPTAVLRLGWNNGAKGYSESDLEGGPLRYALGASGLVDMNMNSTNDAHMRAEVDAIFKWEGWSLTGAYYLSSAQTGRIYMEDRVKESEGAHLQAGYVISELVEPAVRWATVTSQGATDAEDETTNAYTAGLNVFFHGHKLKWSNDFTLALTDSEAGGESTATEFRTQAQLAF